VSTWISKYDAVSTVTTGYLKSSISRQWIGSLDHSAFVITV